MAGKLIVIEGIDGCGKTTQTKILVDRLGSLVNVLPLREPGGTVLGDLLRKVLVERGEVQICTAAETLLFFASRAQLVQEVIKPALDAGAWVVLDRFHLSTWVYQGIVGGGPASVILGLCNQYSIRPDLQIVLDGDAEECLSRAKPGRFESRGLPYAQSVRQAYLKHADFECKKNTTINTSKQTIEEVAALIWREVVYILSPGE